LSSSTAHWFALFGVFRLVLVALPKMSVEQQKKARKLKCC